jgi:hypothetical protein
MQRALLCWLLVLASVALGRAAPLPAAQREASLAYVRGLQNEDGGFRAGAAAGPSQLAATTSSLRALKYLGGSPRDAAAAGRFVRGRFDPALGAFAEPGGQPDVRTTAMGLMSLVELKEPLGQYLRPVTEYLVKNAKLLPDVYIAAAALEAAGQPPADPGPWVAAFMATRSGAGSYGQNAADTAGAVITFLRMGGSVPDRSAVVKVLRAAQRPDGAWGTMGDGSDLSTTYRVMRACFMLKEAPELARVTDFIARCRNADGGYGPSPGKPSTGPTTYYAAIVLHWIEELEKR